jgi:DNA ligase (NAD+)
MKSIIPPTTCPCCNSTLVLVKDQLFCKNISCEAQVNGKLNHFAKAIGIKGLGEKTIEKLQLEYITDIYTIIDKEYLKNIIGEKLADKLINEIERSKDSDFASVLAGMSIPLIGTTAATKLATVVSNFSEINQESCKQAGLGEKATNNLIEWLGTEYLQIKDCLPFEFKQERKVSLNTETKGVICITGKLKSFANKADATIKLESMGYKVIDTLTKAVTILVDESGVGSSKRKTAEERGIQIVTDLNQFIN